VIRFAERLSKTTQRGLGKDEQGCPTMRQFAVFAAQFADFVVTLRVLWDRVFGKDGGGCKVVINGEIGRIWRFGNIWGFWVNVRQGVWKLRQGVWKRNGWRMMAVMRELWCERTN